jgi:hypothetical protein
MKWLVVLSVAAMSVLAATSTAAAASFTCSGTLTGVNVGKVVVLDNDTCTLVGSTVTGDVKVGKNAYFEADATSIQGNVKANQSLTIYTHDGSTISGSVKANKTTQVFLFDGSVGKDVQAQSITGSGHVQVCGMTIGHNVQIQKAGTDILVGDSLAGCGGNTVAGDVKIMNNFTDVELDVQDNAISGKLTVSKNTGPSDKLVVDNTGGKYLQCVNNSGPFVGSPNSGFAKASGQCTTT